MAVCSPSSSCRLRIVCLCQGSIEAVWALGLQSCLVGRSHQCTGPAPVLALPCVSFSSSSDVSPDLSSHCITDFKNILGGYNINWELVQQLQPDLIFAQSKIGADTHFPLQQVQQPMDIKCRVVTFQSLTAEDIFQNLEMIAVSCGVEKEGAKLGSLLRTQWKKVKQKTPQWADGMPRVNVAFLSCVKPLIGAGYWIPEIISYAGGLSMFGRAGCPSTLLTLGDLAHGNPDVVVYLCHQLDAESMAMELSCLVCNKEWRELKAIKANRFFLIDRNRFFIDSAPNVISSTELMTEILHGFGFGHEGQGFMRWQDCAIAQVTKHADINAQQRVVKHKVPALVGYKGGHRAHITVDNHEISAASSSAQDHLKFVTNVYEVKNPASLNEHENVAKAKPDMWEKDLRVVEMNQKHPPGAKIIRQVSPDVVHRSRKLLSDSINSDVMNPSDSQEKWRKPVMEMLKCKRDTRDKTPQMSFNSFFVSDQKNTMQDSNVPHSYSFSTPSSPNPPKQTLLAKSTSSVVNKQQNQKREQEMISKVWASTRFAAQMRNGTVGKDKVFQKSSSLPVARVSRDSKASTACINKSIDTTHVSVEWDKKPKTTTTSSFNRDDNNPLIEGPLCSQAMTDSLNRHSTFNQARTPQLYLEKRCMGRSSSETVLKRKSSYSVPSSPSVDVLSKTTRIFRDLLLKSFVDLQSTDCLLLSGGLASSILAAAIPLVHSKAFQACFTVLAGPAATDRASAAVAVKCEGMEHVIIGEGEKGYAVFLLAKELAFIVETLRSFDPVQIRNLVPISAALREAKSRGFKHVVTGDGLNELISRERSLLNDVERVHFAMAKILSRATVILGEALGIKVIQPFINPNLVREFKAFYCASGSGATEHARATLRQAFPEVSTCCSEKVFNEVDSGMFYVSDYFSSAISASVLENKAKHIHEKERICIRDAEHLVYYRAFKRAFKGKVPKGMARWASKPCSGCGYELSASMSWYCLVCGLSQQSHNNQVKQTKPEGPKIAPDDLNGRKEGKEPACALQASIGNVSCDGTYDDELSGLTGTVSAHREEVNDMHEGADGCTMFGSGKVGSVKGTWSAPGISKSVVAPLPNTKNLRRSMRKPVKEKKPNYWGLLGAGSAGLLLLLQLIRR